MGIDPAPFWANLYLSCYENRFMIDLIRTDKYKASRYHGASRFIDDLCNINDGGEFGRSHNSIYPKELELKVEHNGTHATFLELDITIQDGLFIYKLYDKRDNFPFYIVRMPCLSSNLPSNIFYASIMSEFLRIARATLKLEDFITKASSLYKRMVNQGGDDKMVLRQLAKAYNRHFDYFKNYTCTLSELRVYVSETQ